MITRHLLDQTGFKADEADSGAVTLIQRFGSAANLNTHLHCLVLDGVYRRTDGEPVFVQADSLTDEELQALLYKTITRLMKLPTRRGVLVEAQEGGSCNLADADADADSDGARALRPLRWCRDRGCTSFGSMGCWRPTPSYETWWCRTARKMPPANRI